MAANADELLIDGPKKAPWTVVLAHGAGAGMQTPFMDAIAHGLAEAKIRVVRFEFPYMQANRTTGKSKPPDREPVLKQHWRDIVASLKTPRLVIGGKSMGGRIASLIADEVQAKGLVCLGYPFHPTGKPNQLRVEHLHSLVTPTLIIQGERDPFGNKDEVASYGLPSQIQIEWLADGDHSFKPRVRSGHTLDGHLQHAVQAIKQFIDRLDG